MSPFPLHSTFINHHHPSHHLHSPYKYLRSLSTLQLGWGQTSLVRCHSFRAPLLKEPDVVINTSAVTLRRELFLHERTFKMFSWVVFLTLFTFCSSSKLPLRCSKLAAFTPPAQQSIHRRNPDKNEKNNTIHFTPKNLQTPVIKISMFSAILLPFAYLISSDLYFSCFWWCVRGYKRVLETPSQCWTKPSQLRGLSPREEEGGRGRGEEVMVEVDLGVPVKSL